MNRELFLSPAEARWVIDRWRLDYNHHRIHSALDYQTPSAYVADRILVRASKLLEATLVKLDKLGERRPPGRGMAPPQRV